MQMRTLKAGLLVLGVVGAVGLYNLQNAGKSGGSAQRSEPNPLLALASSELIERARAFDKRLAENSRPRKPGEPIGELILKVDNQNMREALLAIPHSAPEYDEASRILTSYAKHDEEGRKNMAALMARMIAEDADGRKDHANVLERKYLKNGLDIAVSVSGSKNTVLTLRYILFSRPLIYKFVTAPDDRRESDFLSELRQLGFTKVIFSDGHDKSWTFDLKSATDKKRAEAR
jgi:hypothetical protein